MTLREFGQSIVDWWDAYLVEVTTQNVLDWSIGHLVLTFVGGFVAVVVIMTLVGSVFAVALMWLAPIWRRTGLPAFVDRLDQMFGPNVAGVIVVVGSVVFFAGMFLLLALLE